jgi:hypothetical protein
MTLEERMIDFAVSLINAPMEPPPLTALERARRKWHAARRIDEAKEGANDAD